MSARPTEGEDKRATIETALRVLAKRWPGTADSVDLAVKRLLAGFRFHASGTIDICGGEDKYRDRRQSLKAVQTRVARIVKRADALRKDIEALPDAIDVLGEAAPVVVIDLEDIAAHARNVDIASVRGLRGRGRPPLSEAVDVARLAIAAFECVTRLHPGMDDLTGLGPVPLIRRLLKIVGIRGSPVAAYRAALRYREAMLKRAKNRTAQHE
jgi:hypothetical protein